ncbi:Nuclear envelope morphology protein 1 [Xylographa carneopallida]|nr:Nuclear envelope morphology protein 1 [Xylographa carneopallida]
MNSLNILSARVIGQAAQTPPFGVESSRSRSVSEGITNQQSGLVAQPSRSASQHTKSNYSDEVDEKHSQNLKPEDYNERPSVDELVDEKTALLSKEVLDAPPETKSSRDRQRLVVKRLANAIAESLRWVLSKLAAPGVYVVACFYDERGHFSPLLPLRRGRRKSSKKNGSNSTAHAVGLFGSPDPIDRIGASSTEKRTRRPGASPLSERSCSTDTISISTSTSDSEIDRRGKGSTRARDNRSKAQGSVPGDENPPARRSIRIKLRSEDSARRRKTKRAQDATINEGNAADNSPEAITAANLKSPTFPPSSLRLTKYPRAPAPPRPLIPRRQPSYSSVISHNTSNLPQKTLVIDLDETLIHSLAKGGRMSSGHMVEVKLSHPATFNGLSLGPQHPILYYVHKRPHCDDFLKKVCKWYNLVVFTASVQEYADPVIDWLEQERKYFSARYYRQHCTFRNGAYIKDLSSVEPDLSSVVILDNSPLSYIFHEDNAIPIEGWINDPTDNDLLHLIPLLEALQYVTDVRALLALRRGEAEAAL